MRIYLEKAKEVNDLRIIKKFLWFPKKINNEIRWFEKACIKQRVISVEVWSGYKLKWVDEYFM